MPSGIRISSVNLSGKTASVTFLPYTGGTIDLGEKTLPFEYTSSYPYGIYELYFELYNETYEVNAIFPSPSITPTITRTPSITPTITRTPSITPSPTSSAIIEDLNFNGFINSGSIIITYIITIPTAVDFDVTVDFVQELPIIGGGRPFYIKGNVIIPRGSTQVGAKYSSSEEWADYSKLSGVSVLTTTVTTPEGSRQYTVKELIKFGKEPPDIGSIPDYAIPDPNSISVSPTPSRTITPTPTRTITPSITPTRTITPSITPTPSQLPCPCNGPVGIPFANTPGNPIPITIRESIDGNTTGMYRYIQGWLSNLVDVCGYPNGNIREVSNYRPNTFSSGQGSMYRTVTDSFYTKSYSYMLAIKTVPFVAPHLTIPNFKITIGTGVKGDCSFGTYVINNPSLNTWYVIRVDVRDVTLYGSEIWAHVVQEGNSSYYLCSNPGDDSCCYVTTSGADVGSNDLPYNHPCPCSVTSCLDLGTVPPFPINFWCPNPWDTPVCTLTPTPTKTITPTRTPSITSSVTPTITTSITSSVTPTPSITSSVTPTSSITPSVTPSITPTSSLTPSVTSSITPTPTPSITSSVTPTPSVTSSITPSLTPTPSVTPSITPSLTPTSSITPTPSVTPSITPSLTPTSSITPTPSVTPSITPSVTPTSSITPSITPTRTITPTPTPSPQYVPYLFCNCLDPYNNSGIVPPLEVGVSSSFTIQSGVQYGFIHTDGYCYFNCDQWSGYTMTKDTLTINQCSTAYCVSLPYPQPPNP